MSVERHTKNIIQLALKISHINYQDANKDLEALIAFCIAKGIRKDVFSGIFEKIYNAIHENSNVDEKFKLIINSAQLVKNHSDAVCNFFVAFFQIIPFYMPLRKEVKKLLPEMQSQKYLKFSEKNIYELGMESVKIQMDSFLQVEDRNHCNLVEYLLHKYDSKIQVSNGKQTLPRHLILVKNQMRNDESFLDRQDTPLYLEHFFVEKHKFIISVIDFDSAQYLDKELYCKNALIALSEFLRKNSGYKACLIVTGKIEKSLAEWIQTPLEDWKHHDLSISNVEVLYAMPHVNSRKKLEIFFHPLRSVQNTGIRVAYGKSEIELAWRYVDFLTLLEETKQEHASHSQLPFKSLLWQNFKRQINCIYSPSRDNIDFIKTIDELLALAREKFVKYIHHTFSSSLKREQAELENILMSLKLSNTRKDSQEMIKKSNCDQITECCLDIFDKDKTLLTLNLNKIIATPAKERTIPLDWGHIIQDTFVKGINYTQLLDGSFLSCKLPKMLSLYEENIPYYNIKTYIFYLIEDNKKYLHARGFNNNKKFNFAKKEENRIRSRETLWQARLEILLVNLFLIIMRKNFNELELVNYAESVADILCTNIHLNDNKSYDLFLNIFEQFKKEYLDDFSKHACMHLLFNEKKINFFLKGLESYLKSKKRDNDKSLEEQYDSAYKALLELPLLNLGFNLLQLMSVAEHINVTDELPESDPEMNNFANQLKVSLTILNSILDFLQSLESFNHSDMGLSSQAKNLYLKKLYHRELLLCKFIYVIVDNVITFAPESFFRSEGEFTKAGQAVNYERPAHSQLAKGQAVQAAGECIFVKVQNTWCLRFITNGSGHYRPDAFKTLQLAEEVFRKSLNELAQGNFINLSKLTLRNTITPNITFGSSDFLPNYTDFLSDTKPANEVLPQNSTPKIKKTLSYGSFFAPQNSNATVTVVTVAPEILLEKSVSRGERALSF